MGLDSHIKSQPYLSYVWTLKFLIKIFYNVCEQKLLPKLEYSKSAWDGERLYNDWCVGTSKVKLGIPFSLNRLPSSISALSLHVIITWWITRGAISRICPRLLNILVGTIDEKPLETNHTESKPKPKTPKVHIEFFSKIFKIFSFFSHFSNFVSLSKRYYLHQFCSLAPKCKNIKNLNMRTEINYDFCRLLWMLKKELLLRLKWSWREWRWNPLGQESGQCRYLSFRTISLLC